MPCIRSPPHEEKHALGCFVIRCHDMSPPLNPAVLDKDATRRKNRQNLSHGESQHGRRSLFASVSLSPVRAPAGTPAQGGGGAVFGWTEGRWGLGGRVSRHLSVHNTTIHLGFQVLS